MGPISKLFCAKSICYDYTRTFTVPVQHVMGNSPDLRANAILQRIKNLGIVCIVSAF